VEPFNIQWTNSAAETSQADDVTNRNFIINDLPADIYDITVTDVNGTVFVLKVDVVSLLDITISETVTHVLCNGKSDGKISFSANGGNEPYTIIVNNGATEIFNEVGVAANEDKLIENIPAGDYSFAITDASGCSANKVITVNQSDALTVVASDIVNPSSETSTDGSVKITVAGGKPKYDIAIYSISDDGTETFVNQFEGVSLTEVSFSNLTIGHYKVTVADVSGCDVAVTEFTLSSFKFIATAYPVLPCPDMLGKIELNIVGGAAPFNVVVKLGDKEIANTTVDITGTTSFDKLSVGDYSISIVDAKGNNPENNLEIVKVENLKYIVPSEVNSARCNFHFNNDDIEIGSIKIHTDQITVNYPGDHVLSFAWEHEASDVFKNNIEGLNAGDYILDITSDLIGDCVYKETIEVDASTNIIVKAGNDRIICKGSETKIEYEITLPNNYQKKDVKVDYNFEPLSVEYNNENSLDALIRYIPEKEGVCEIKVSYNNCSNFDDVKVDFHPQIDLELLRDSVGKLVPRDYVLVGSYYDFAYNEIVRHDEGVNTTYKWGEAETKFSFVNGTNPTTKEPIISFINPQIGEYADLILTATSDKGCQEKSEFRIHFIGSTPPNAISPNDDGIHDSWKIPNAEQYKDIEVTILNRWGIKVFYTKHYSNSGDYGDCFKGLSSGGNKLPAGTYYFVIDYNRDGSSPVKGSITIIR
ncbi:MAG: gliding motility-associated C-terminal domain-containing protein, partial [Bacteroidales bacterium]|nr:gliding motility-associated C-terminal domain-containing protein [Bacteroidales bacterium]